MQLAKPVGRGEMPLPHCVKRFSLGENVGDSGMVGVKSARLEGSTFESAFGNKPYFYFASSYSYLINS
jgi:hypothetical protein